MADPSDGARKTAKCLLCFGPQYQHAVLASTHWRAGCCVQPQRVLGHVAQGLKAAGRWAEECVCDRAREEMRLRWW